NATLAKDVRPWIDAALPSKTPYTLKLILTPLPNRSLEEGDEEKSLEELDLMPSATLVLVPIGNFSTAYSDNAGPLARMRNSMLAFYTFVIGYVTSLVDYVQRLLVGTGQTAGLASSGQASASAPARKESEHGSPTGSKVDKGQAGIKVRTLADQRRDDPATFYNGNSINFEPNRKNDQGDEDSKRK
ncbi:hypothetical protein LTS18_010060, partial [Coniosporium uncinatum]